MSNMMSVISVMLAFRWPKPTTGGRQAISSRGELFKAAWHLRMIGGLTCNITGGFRSGSVIFKQNHLHLQPETIETGVLRSSKIQKRIKSLISSPKQHGLQLGRQGYQLAWRVTNDDSAGSDKHAASEAWFTNEVLVSGGSVKSWCYHRKFSKVKVSRAGCNSWLIYV